MIGDTASDLSITLLCNILQGNADAVPADIVSYSSIVYFIQFKLSFVWLTFTLN